MSSNFTQNAPYLRTSREFPEDSMQSLTVEINKSYVEIANAVNNRTIGLFSKNRPTITGESWFINSNAQQTIRQIYTFTAKGNIPHGINTSRIGGFVRIYGTFTDGSVWYPVPYVDHQNINHQVEISVNSANIVINSGAGAPTISSGFVVLEWISLA